MSWRSTTFSTGLFWVTDAVGMWRGQCTCFAGTKNGCFSMWWWLSFGECLSLVDLSWIVQVLNSPKSQKLVLASWSYSCFSKGRGKPESNTVIFHSDSPSKLLGHFEAVLEADCHGLKSMQVSRQNPIIFQAHMKLSFRSTPLAPQVLLIPGPWFRAFCYWGWFIIWEWSVKPCGRRFACVDMVWS